MSWPISVSMRERDKLVGMYAVMYRNNVKVPAKIVRIDVEAGRVIYELMGGPDKGKRFSSRYDESQTANVYDWDHFSLALLET